MVRHIVIWDHLDGLSAEEKAANGTKIKQALEGLLGEIPGLISITIYTDLLTGSNAGVVLDSVFESSDALFAYQEHPAHVKVASGIVRPNTRNRRCADYEM